MRSFQRLLCVWFVALLPSTIRAQSDPKVTAPDAELKLVAEGYSFTEGPTADEAGNVFFTDQPNNRIIRFDFDSGQVETWMEPSGRSNGLFFVHPQKMIACADENNELWVIHPESKQHKVIVGQFEGRRFGGPNDCWVDRDGTIYFTDPLYKRPYWKHTISSDHPRGVYRVTTSGEVIQELSDLRQPNGIIGDSQQRLLWVADIGAKRTYRFKITEDGSLSDQQLFCESGSDGMTLDNRGNVYLTGNQGVTVFDPQGKLIQTIAVPRRWTANVTFAGPNNQHLFITAGDAVFTIEMKVKGGPSS